MNIKSKGKRRFIKKVKKLRKSLRKGEITINDVKRKMAGHIGYINIANKDKLVQKYLYLNGKID